MKKVLLLASLLCCSLKGFSQSKEELLLQVFSTIDQYATRLVLYKSPGYYIIQDPKAQQWGDLFTFESSDKSISIAMDKVSIATVEPYGIILTGPTGEATIYMDLSTKPQLQSDLQHALNNYIELEHMVRYTVRE